MKILILTTLLSFSSFAEMVCVNNVCNEVDVTEGRSLMKFDDDQKKAIAPVPNTEEYKNIPRVDNQNHYSQLKFVNIKVGMCLIDTKTRTMYKILSKDEKKRNFRFVSEGEVHNYTLKVNTLMWDFPETRAFKSLQVWNCANTANLSDSGYINKCVGKATMVTRPCSPPRLFK